MQSTAKRSRAYVALLAALVAWSGSIVRGGFTLDDREVILENPVVDGSLPWTAAFERDFMHHVGDAGQYRPLATLSFAFDHAVWGEEARGYHATNVALHAAVVALAAFVLARAAPGAGSRGGALGLVCFAVHPVLADSVAWVAGRTSMLSALGGLTGLAVLVVARRPATVLSSGAGLLLGLLAKEDALVLAPLYVVVAASRSRRHALLATAGAAAAIALYLLARGAALGAALPHAVNAPLASLPMLERLGFGGRALLEALRLVLLPFAYPPSYRAAPGFTPAAAPGLLGRVGVLAGCAALVALALVVRRRRAASPDRRVVYASVALALVACLPFFQIAPSGEVFAPRFLYLPLLAAVPALGALLERLPRALLLALAVLGVVLAWQRSGVYASRASYAEATLARVPGDARSWNDLGLAREEEGDPRGARAAWERALAEDPEYGRACSNLARLALTQGDLAGAERLLERAVELGPRNPTARCNLGAVLLRRGDLHRAAEAYRGATEIAPGMAAAWRGLGNALERTGELEAARAALQRALELDPGDAGAARLLERLDDPSR